MHFVYFNLHKKLFSLRNTSTRRVEGHAKAVVLHDAIFKVSEAGRQRVLKEKRKNVHAGVQGKIQSVSLTPRNRLAANKLKTRDWIELTYNPYKYESFVVKSIEVPVKSAQEVILIDKKIYARGLK
jgi:hypothetical protein